MAAPTSWSPFSHSRLDSSEREIDDGHGQLDDQCRMPFSAADS